MGDLNVLGLVYISHAALPHLLSAAASEPRQVADLMLVSSVAGRVPSNGSGVYNLTKHGVGAFGESLSQEVTKQHVRVSLVEPGAVLTELTSRNWPEIQELIAARWEGMERLEAGDIADAIGYIVTPATPDGGQRDADQAHRAGGLRRLTETRSGLGAAAKDDYVRRRRMRMGPLAVDGSTT